MTTPADPGAINLKVLKNRYETVPEIWMSRPHNFADICKLIAAIEALRERVAELEPYEKSCLKVTDWCTKHDRSDITSSTELIEAIEAAEARGVELAGALNDIARGMCGNEVSLDQAPDKFGSAMWEWSQKKARTTLAATPAQAMERARAVETVAKEAKRYRDDRSYGNGVLNIALDKLDALGKEEE